MSATIAPMIILNTLKLDGDALIDALIDAVMIARMVARVNGNKESANRQIILITDEFTEVKRLMPTAVDTKCNNAYGITYTHGNSVIIWLSPDLNLHRTQHEIIETYIHELAHAVSHARAVHGWSWRRMNAILLVAIAPLFHETYDWASKIYSSITRYQRRGITDRHAKYEYATSNDRLWEEADRHIKAVQRMVKRLTKLGIIK